MLENIPGLAYQGKNEGLEFIARTIRKINRDRGTRYTLAVAKLNAADFGVPQMRPGIGARNRCQPIPEESDTPYRLGWNL